MYRRYEYKRALLTIEYTNKIQTKTWNVSMLLMVWLKSKDYWLYELQILQVFLDVIVVKNE